MTGGPEIRRSPVIVGVAFLVHNLLPVTIGHVSGGALFVAAVYDLVYLGRHAAGSNSANRDGRR